MDRLFRYLLSYANISGSFVSLVVLTAYLGGVIETGWALLVVGGYAGGALPFLWKTPSPERMPEGLNTADALKWLRTTAMPALPTASQSILGEILATADELMPRLKEMEKDGRVEAANRAQLKQAIVRLLPDALENYMRLPPAYARAAISAGGKSPQQLLNDQLRLLRDHVRSIEESLVSADLNAMLANGKFLEEKFQNQGSAR